MTVTFGVVLLSLLVQGLTIPWLTRRLGLAGEARSAGERDREVLLDGFVRAHEELVRLEDAGVVGRVERRDLERAIDAGETSVLEGLPPLVDEPGVGRRDCSWSASASSSRSAGASTRCFTAARSPRRRPHL